VEKRLIFKKSCISGAAAELNMGTFQSSFASSKSRWNIFTPE
jgi:hypothetical protein